MTPRPPWIWIAVSRTDCGDPRGDHLDRRDLGPRPVGADPVDHPGRLQHQQADLLDRASAPRRSGLRTTPFSASGEPKATRSCGPRAGHLQGPLGHPDAAHRVVDAARPEPRLGDREPLPLARRAGSSAGTRTPSKQDLAVAMLVLGSRRSAGCGRSSPRARRAAPGSSTAGGARRRSGRSSPSPRGARSAGRRRRVVHHLWPSITYSSPSRTTRVAMLRASEEATAGSVIEKPERICAVEQRGAASAPSAHRCAKRCEELHVAGVRGGAVERLGGDVGGAAGESRRGGRSRDSRGRRGRAGRGSRGRARAPRPSAPSTIGGSVWSPGPARAWPAARRRPARPGRRGGRGSLRAARRAPCNGARASGPQRAKLPSACSSRAWSGPAGPTGRTRRTGWRRLPTAWWS